MTTDIKGSTQPTMNGDDESIMKALLLYINTHQLSSMRDYMSELWARGVTKDQFLQWVERQTNASNGTE